MGFTDYPIIANVTDSDTGTNGGMNAIYVALIAAAAVVIAEIIRIWVSRRESNDRLARLQKEVEILGKLRDYPEADKAHTAVLAQVLRSADSLLRESVMRDQRMHPLYGNFWNGALLAVMGGLLILQFYARGHWHGHWYSVVHVAFWIATAMITVRGIAAWAWTARGNRKEDEPVKA